MKEVRMIIKNRKMEVRKFSHRYETSDELNEFGVLCGKARRVNVFEGEWKEEEKEERINLPAGGEDEVKH